MWYLSREIYLPRPCYSPQFYYYSHVNICRGIIKINDMASLYRCEKYSEYSTELREPGIWTSIELHLKRRSRTYRSLELHL
jgi:hypothetical protein